MDGDAVSGVQLANGEQIMAATTGHIQRGPENNDHEPARRPPRGSRVCAEQDSQHPLQREMQPSCIWPWTAYPTSRRQPGPGWANAW